MNDQNISLVAAAAVMKGKTLREAATEQNLQGSGTTAWGTTEELVTTVLNGLGKQCVGLPFNLLRFVQGYNHAIRNLASSAVASMSDYQEGYAFGLSGEAKSDAGKKASDIHWSRAFDDGQRMKQLEDILCRFI